MAGEREKASAQLAVLRQTSRSQSHVTDVLALPETTDPLREIDELTSLSFKPFWSAAAEVY